MISTQPKSLAILQYLFAAATVFPKMPDRKDPATGRLVRQEGPEPVDPATGKPKARPRFSWADISALATLLVLYFLQGVPMGVCAAMPMLFQDANMSDSDQGKFSFASWPFSLKVRRALWTSPHSSLVLLALVLGCWCWRCWCF